MQGMCNYIPETNHVSRMYSVEAILWLQYMVYVKLFPQLNAPYLYKLPTLNQRMLSIPNSRQFTASQYT